MKKLVKLLKHIICLIVHNKSPLYLNSKNRLIDFFSIYSYYYNYLTKALSLEDPRVRLRQLQNEKNSTESIPMQVIKKQQRNFSILCIPMYWPLVDNFTVFLIIYLLLKVHKENVHLFHIVVVLGVTSPYFNVVTNETHGCYLV